MVTLLPAPFSCLYRPIPCPVGDHLLTTGEELTVYEALPCAQCRFLNETAATAFQRRPRLGQHERMLLTALAQQRPQRPLPAMALAHLRVPEPRPGARLLTQSARLLAARALAVVTLLPRIVVQHTGTTTLKDTVWIEATTVGYDAITFAQGSSARQRRRRLPVLMAQTLQRTTDVPALLVRHYLERLSELLVFLIPTLHGLHPQTQQRARGQARLHACTIALQQLRRVDATRSAAVMTQSDATLADHFLPAQCRPTTGDDHPSRDEYCRSGSRDREN